MMKKQYTFLLEFFPEFFNYNNLIKNRENYFDKKIPQIPRVTPQKLRMTSNPLTIQDVDMDIANGNVKSPQRPWKDMDKSETQYWNYGFGGTSHVQNHKAMSDYMLSINEKQSLEKALNNLDYNIKNYDKYFKKEMDRYNFSKQNEILFGKTTKPDYQKGLQELEKRKNDLISRIEAQEKEIKRLRDIAEKENKLAVEKYNTDKKYDESLSEKNKKDVEENENARRIREKQIKQKAKDITRMQQIGSITGMTAGGIGGNYLARKLGKTQKRNEIKQIILSSNNPQEAIVKLSTLNTSIAKRYINRINSVKNSPQWKQLSTKNITLKNSLIKGSGTIGGGIAGGLLGSYGGEKLGYYLYDK